MTELIDPPPDTAITDLDLALSMSQPLACPSSVGLSKAPWRISPGTGPHDCQEPLVDIPFDTSGSVKGLLHGEHTSASSLCN
jgi:hypothetical protein